MTDDEQVKWNPAGYWQRFRTRRLSIDDVFEVYTRGIIPLLVPSVLTLFTLTGDAAADDWSNALAMWYVWPVYMGVFVLMAYRAESFRCSWSGKFWLLVPGLVATFLCAFVSMGYFMLANAITGDDSTPVWVHGPVIEKYHATSRGTGFNGYLTIEFEGRPVKMLVPSPDYKHYQLGDEYGQEFYRGGYGYFYRWEWFTSWK